MDKVTFAGARALCGSKPGLPGDTKGGFSLYCPSPPPLCRSLAPGLRGERVLGWQNHPRSWSDWGRYCHALLSVLPLERLF